MGHAPIFKDIYMCDRIYMLKWNFTEYTYDVKKQNNKTMKYKKIICAGKFLNLHIKHCYVTHSDKFIFK